MSFYTTCILSMGFFDSQDKNICRKIEEYNDYTLRHERYWWTIVPKNPRLWLGEHNHFHLYEFKKYLVTIPWKELSSVQLFHRHESEDVFEMWRLRTRPEYGDFVSDAYIRTAFPQRGEQIYRIFDENFIYKVGDLLQWKLHELEHIFKNNTSLITDLLNALHLRYGMKLLP